MLENENEKTQCTKSFYKVFLFFSYMLYTYLKAWSGPFGQAATHLTFFLKTTWCAAMGLGPLSGWFNIHTICGDIFVHTRTSYFVFILHLNRLKYKGNNWLIIFMRKKIE